MLFRLLFSICVLFALAGCGAPGHLKNDLVQPTKITGFTLEADIQYIAKGGFGVVWIQTLKTGEYVSILENDNGILYKGPALCVSRKLDTKELGPHDGGIWMPKPGRSDKPLLWYYANTELKAEDYSPDKLGVVGGLAMNLIFAANKGEIEFWAPIEDAKFLSHIDIKPFPNTMH